MIPEQTIESVLYSTAIERTVERSGVRLVRAGSVLKGCCPFHDEKTPSFVVWPKTGRYKCFGCGAGGNAITYVMKKSNLTYPEAIRSLAADAGIPIEERKPTEQESQAAGERARLYALNEAAADFYRGNLKGDALQYARSRWNDQTLDAFRIGFAPDQWHALHDHLKAQGYTDDEMLAAGLVKRGQKDGCYDFFRNRIIFPVANRVHRIVGFSGRDLSGSDDTPKYVNTPDSPVYHKGRELYGLNYAIPTIKKYDVCIIVEGNPDVVKMHQLGVCNVVAACGTALTQDQIAAIARHTRNICLLYDNDRAGRAATARNADMIVAAGLTALTLSIPDMEDGSKQDPDTYFTSAKQFSNFYNNCKCNYLVAVARDKADNCVNDPEYKAKTIKDICSRFKDRPENEKAALIEELAAIIPTKSIWNKSMRELATEKKEEDRKKQENERSERQNEMYKLYGFYEKNLCYWFHNPKGEGMFCGSNFVMEPLFHIESVINAKRLYRITNVYGVEKVIEFPQKDLISLSAFKLRCESLGNFLFEGGEYGLAKIKAYLYEKTQTCKEITQMGWQKPGFFAWANGIYDGNGFKPISKEGIVTHAGENYYIPALSSFYAADDTLYMFERKFRHQPGKVAPRQWLDLLCKVYGDNAMVGFAFCVATLFRDVIVKQTRYFPILNIFGVKGSGKSEMAMSLLKLFGDLPVGINMTTATLPAMADHVAQTANAVCHIDEYKNSIEYDKIEYLKGLWDGTGRNRMNMDKDKKKEMTAVDAGIILTGQEMPKADIALFSRVVFTTFTKTKFTEVEKELYDRLKGWERGGLTHITHELMSHRREFADTYWENHAAAAEDLARQTDKNSLEDRIWRNWLVITAALRTISHLVELPFPYAAALDAFARMMKEQNDETIKDNEVNTFWDIFTYLVKEGFVEAEYDYKILHTTALKTTKYNIMRPTTVIAIDKSRVLQLYQKHCKTTGTKALPLSTLKFYLQNSPEYLGEKVFKMKRRIDHLQNRQDSVQPADPYTGGVKYRVLTVRLDCFNYAALALDIEDEFAELDKEDF